MNKAFEVHMLNEQGKKRAKVIADIFDDALVALYLPEGREKSIVITKLEEACFFAKKAMASQVENQEVAK